jgi:hypothetical protein
MLALLASAPAAAQRRTGAAVPNKPELGGLGARINANTIAVISGNLNATYVAIAYDLSAVLDDGDAFRILPVIGRGGGQNIKDMRFMQGADLGITQSNLLGAYKRSNEIGPIDDKIVYIAKLFNEEMHPVVPRLAEFQKPPRHPKWREAILAAVLPGWKRFEGAEEWLRTHDKTAERAQFDAFVGRRAAKPVALPTAERDRLFQEFLSWSKSRENR